MTAEDLKSELAKHASVHDAVFLQRFFKTGPGEYGEGDVFIGVRVPKTRLVCKKFHDLSVGELSVLLKSPVHEHRLAALLIATMQYKRVDHEQKQRLFDLYINGLALGQINNWDLIDVTCEYIVGEHLRSGPKTLLLDLAQSKSLWERRVAIISTFTYIKAGDPVTTLSIARELLYDKEDLIHKAVGWMLREVGKRVDESLLEAFLDEHAAIMPRTMLRYAIERLPEPKRQHYLKFKK